MSLDELEKLAKAATPGPWHDMDCGAPDCWCRIVVTDVAMPKDVGQTVVTSGSVDKQDATYIAAANPQSMLALLAVVRAAPGALEALEGVFDDARRLEDLSVSGGMFEGIQCRDAIAALRSALDGIAALSPPADGAS